jgi:hypothetical protein
VLIFGPGKLSVDTLLAWLMSDGHVRQTISDGSGPSTAPA